MGESQPPDGAAAHAYAARAHGGVGWSVGLLALLPVPLPLWPIAASALLAAIWRSTRPARGRPSPLIGERRLSRGLAVLATITAFAAQRGGWPWLLPWAALWSMAMIGLAAHLQALALPGSRLRADAEDLGRCWWSVAGALLALLLLSGSPVQIALDDVLAASSLRRLLYGAGVTFLGVYGIVMFAVLLPLTFAFFRRFGPPDEPALLRGLRLESPSLDPGGMRVSGRRRGLDVEVRIVVERAPAETEIRVEVPDLAAAYPGLRLRRRAPGERDSDLSDPLLRGLIWAEGASGAEADALLAGCHAEVLAVLHAWPASTVEGGAVRLRVAGPPYPREPGLVFLQQRVAEAVRLAESLIPRSDELPLGMPAPCRRKGS